MNPVKVGQVRDENCKGTQYVVSYLFPNEIECCVIFCDGQVGNLDLDEIKDDRILDSFPTWKEAIACETFKEGKEEDK